MMFLLTAALADDASVLTFEPVFPHGVAVPRVLRDTTVVPCTCAPAGPSTPATEGHIPGDGLPFVDLRVKVRKGRVSLISVASASPGMLEYMPCI